MIHFVCVFRTEIFNNYSPGIALYLNIVCQSMNSLLDCISSI